jgi:putative DNA primase/helicase
LIEHLYMHRWVRTRTVDHPRKRNGAYLFAGEYGHVCNWATMEGTETWFRDKEARTDPEMLARMEASRQREDRKRHEDALRAEQTASEMISRAVQWVHPYLESKGLPEVKGLVLDGTLLVRMENEYGHLVGLQTIEMVDGEWKKKMLARMRAKGARLAIGRGDWPILCEGYATGLSIDRVLQSSRSRAFVVVCFSAGNIPEVAKSYPNARVFADNDISKAGEHAAIKSGRPWVMSDTVGEDANDLWRRDPNALAYKLVELKRLRFS